MSPDREYYAGRDQNGQRPATPNCLAQCPRSFVIPATAGRRLARANYGSLHHAPEQLAAAQSRPDRTTETYNSIDRRAWPPHFARVRETGTAAWQASNARLHFSDIVDAAMAGTPRFVELRDGKAVVVVSRAYYEKTKPSLRTFLLDAGYSGAGEAAFDESLRDIRATAPDLLTPR